MKNKVLCACLCGLVFLSAGCEKKQIPQLEDGKQVVAEIDGKKVTADDLYETLKKQYGVNLTINLLDQFIADKEVPDNDEAKEYAESQIAMLKLTYSQSGGDLESDLLNSGYSSIEEYQKVLANNYKMNQVVKKYLKGKLTEDEINKYYENEVFGEMTVRHILIKPATTSSMTDAEKTEAENKALEKAKELIEKLNKGEAKFEDLAKEYSDDGTASDGGLYADFTKQKVVSEFWDASYALKDGEYTKTPVKTTYGYHVILRVSQKDKPELKDVKENIEDTLVSDKLADDSALTYKTWANIRNDYKIKIYDTDIESTYNRTVKSYK